MHFASRENEKLNIESVLYDKLSTESKDYFKREVAKRTIQEIEYYSPGIKAIILPIFAYPGFYILHFYTVSISEYSNP